MSDFSIKQPDYSKISELLKKTDTINRNKAFKLLHNQERKHKKVTRMLFSLGCKDKHLIDDVLQESLIKLYFKKNDTYTNPYALWKKIAHNYYIDILRKKKIPIIELSEELILLKVNEFNIITEKRTQEIVLEKVNLLKKECLEFLIGKYSNPKKIPDWELMPSNPDKTRKQLAKAGEKIRKRCEQKLLKLLAKTKELTPYLKKWLKRKGLIE